MSYDCGRKLYILAKRMFLRLTSFDIFIGVNRRYSVSFFIINFCRKLFHFMGPLIPLFMGASALDSKARVGGFPGFHATDWRSTRRSFA